MPWGSKLVISLAHLYFLAPHLSFSPYPFPVSRLKRKEGQKKERAKKEKENRNRYHDLEGAALRSPLSHGRARLDSFHHYTKPPTKTDEAWWRQGSRPVGCRWTLHFRRLRKDTWCPLRLSMSGDSVCHHIYSSACSNDIMISSFTTSLPQESCISQHLHLYVRPTWGSTLILICGNTSFTSGIHKILEQR
jgi:hypothetical protein